LWNARRILIDAFQLAEYVYGKNGALVTPRPLWKWTMCKTKILHEPYDTPFLIHRLLNWKVLTLI
jgi:hypothetical protein